MPIPQIPGVPLIDPFGNPIEPVPVEPYAPVPAIPPIGPAQGPPPELTDTPSMAAQDYFQGVPDPSLPSQGVGPQGEPVAQEFPPKHWFPEYLTGPQAEAAPPEQLADTAPQMPGDMFGGSGGPPTAPKNAPVAAPRQSSGDPYLDVLEDSGRAREEAVRMEGEAKRAENEFRQRESVRIADEDAERARKDDEFRLQNATIAREKTETLNQEALDLANSKVDDGKLLNDMSIGQKLAMAVSSMIHGWYHPGEKNPVVGMLNTMVERSIATQKANLENRHASLNTRRGILADELSLGRDEVEARYKTSRLMGERAINMMNAEALRFNNPVIDAQTITAVQTVRDDMTAKELAHRNYLETKGVEERRYQEDLALQKRQVGIQAFNARSNDQQWRAADQRARDALEMQQNAPPETNVPLMREQRNAKEEEEARQIRGPSGRVIGRADAPEGAVNARKIVDNAARGKALYLRGRELFKDGRSRNPASDLYREQKAFDTAWINYTKTADGDFSAPNATDFENRGVFAGFSAMNPLAALEEGHRNARNQGAAALKMYVPEDELIREDLIDAPQKDTAEGNRQGWKNGKPPEEPGPSLTERSTEALRPVPLVPSANLNPDSKVTLRSSAGNEPKTQGEMDEWSKADPGRFFQQVDGTWIDLQNPPADWVK